MLTLLYVDFENGDTIEATGKEIYDLTLNSGETWLITANATIFLMTNRALSWLARALVCRT